MSTSTGACARTRSLPPFTRTTYTHTEGVERDEKQMTFGQTICHRVSGNVNNFVIKFRYDYISVLKVSVW